MEWIQRNPKKTVGLSALAVLVVVILVWGMSGGGSPDKSTLGGPPLATPTAMPSHRLTVLPTPSAVPSAVGEVVDGFPSGGLGSSSGIGGGGYDKSLPRHRVVITAGSPDGMLGVGWRIPLGDGPRSGTMKSPGRSFQHSTVTYGEPDYAQLYAYVGPNASKVWCTVLVDGRVTDHRIATGPWGQVFCQG
jgi:hypothetical protein